MYFSAARLAVLMKAGRWPAGAPGQKGGQFAPKSVVSGNSKLMMPQFGYGLHPGSKAEQEGGPKAQSGSPMAVEPPKPKGTPHPNAKPGDPDVRITHPTKASGAESWADPNATATFVPGGPMPDKLNGIPLKPWTPPADHAGWARVDGQNHAIDPHPIEAVDGKSIGAGVIIQEPDGRVWLTKPTNHYGGYQQTFPKGTQEEGLSLQATAIKEAFEETGLKVRLVGHFGDVERDTSVARYYIAERVGGTPADMGWESQALRLTPPDKLAGLLNRSRDLEMAKAIVLELTPAKVRKAGAKPGNHHSATQPRWPAGSPLGGQWMTVGADGIVIPPTIAGGLTGSNAAYQAKANAAHLQAQVGGKEALAKITSDLTDKVTANNAKVAAGGSTTSHMKWTAQLLQYVTKLVTDMGAKTGAEAAAIKATGTPKLSDWGNQLAPKPGGSNPGAIYMDPASKAQWLVKGNNAKPATGAQVSDDRARNEVLAAKLTALGGAGSVDMKLLDLGTEWGGGLGVATKMLAKGSFAGFNPHDPSHVAAARADFAVHAWLANYDVLGSGYDNTVIANGKAICIDPGGALFFRAQGHLKDPPPGPDASEWESMRKNSAEQKAIFGSMTAAQLQDSAKKLASITDDQIDIMVGSVLSGAKAASTSALLKSRRDAILTKAGLVAKQVQAPTPVAPTVAPPKAPPVKVAAVAPTPPVPPLPNVATPTAKKFYNVTKIGPLSTPLPGMVATPTSYLAPGVLSSFDNVGIAMADMHKLAMDPKAANFAMDIGAQVDDAFEKITETMGAGNTIKAIAGFEAAAAEAHELQLTALTAANTAGVPPGAIGTIASAIANVVTFAETVAKMHNTKVWEAAQAAQAAAQPGKPAPTPAPAPQPTAIGTPPSLSEVSNTPIPKGYGLAGMSEKGAAQAMLDALDSGDAGKLKAYAPMVGGLKNYPLAVTTTNAEGKKLVNLSPLATFYAKTAKAWDAKYGTAHDAQTPGQGSLADQLPVFIMPANVLPTKKQGIINATTALHALALAGDLAGLKAFKNKSWAVTGYQAKLIKAVEAHQAPPPPAAVMPAAAFSPPPFVNPGAPSSTAKVLFEKWAVDMLDLAKAGKIAELKAFNSGKWSSVSAAGKEMTAYQDALVKAAVVTAGTNTAAVMAGTATITSPGGNAHRVVKGVLTPTPPPPQPAPAMPDFAKFKTSSPANAASHNAKIDKIAGLASKGDVAGLLALKFGSNTYGKQQQKAANAALAALGSGATVVQNQPAASHPALTPGAAPPPQPATAPKAPAAPPPPKEGAEAAAKLATRMPTAPDVTTITSKPWKAAANNAALDAVKAAAQVGTVAALEQLTFAVLDDNGNPTGATKPIAEHPSKHVQGYHAAVLAELKEVLNPAPPLAAHKVVDAKTSNHIAAHFKGKPAGTKVANLPKSEQFGFWVALGKTARGVDGLKPAVTKPLSSAWKAQAKSKFPSFNNLTKFFVEKTQASSAMADAFRDGATQYQGVNLAEMNKAVHKDAMELPEGTTLTRWHHMDSGMVKQLMAAPNGMVIQATAQMSTSYHPTATQSFGPHEITFVMAKGAKLIPSFATGNFAGEYELSTLPGARFVLLDKKKKPNGMTHMEVLLLPPEM